MDFADEQQREFAFKLLPDAIVECRHRFGEYVDFTRLIVCGIPAPELTTAATLPGHEPDLMDLLRVRLPKVQYI